MNRIPKPDEVIKSEIVQQIKPMRLDRASLADAGFVKDMRDFWSRSRSGNLMGHVTEREAFRLWEEFTKVTAYYPFTADVDILLNHQGFYRDAIRGDGTEHVTVIDLGPGSTHAIMNKTVPFLSIVEADCYVAVDRVWDPILNARFTVKDAMPEIALQSRHHDFFHDNFEIGVDRHMRPLSIPTQSKRVFLAMGLPYGNLEGFPDEGLPKQALVAAFSNIADHMRKGDKFIASIDVNHDRESLEAAYGHPLNGQLVRSVLERIPAEFQTIDFHLSHFEQWSQWMPEKHMYGMGLRAKKDIAFMFNGESMSWKKGQSSTFMNAYKYPPEFLTEVIGDSGLQCTASLPDGHKRVHHYVMEL